MLSSGFRPAWSQAVASPSAVPPVEPRAAGDAAAFAPLRVTRVRPWARLHALRDALEPALAVIADGRPSAPGALAAVHESATELQRLCALDPDAMLAVPLLLAGGGYATRHALATAVALEFMLARHGTVNAVRRSAVRAALTMNVGMHTLQESLHAHAGALTPGQRAGVLAHPEAGVARLRDAGVDDPTWLAIVAQHHEHADGSGYPARIGGTALRFESQALMVAERWCAMVAARSYRPGAPPDRALALLLGRLGGQADPRVGTLLADAIGPLPPGSPVRLADGELGVVWRRTAVPGEPTVLVLRAPDGLPIDGGIRRATADPRHRIVDCTSRDALGPALDPEVLWEASEMAAEA